MKSNKMINTKTKWYRLFSREGIDVATLLEVDKAFYRLIRELARKNGEVFFTELKNKVFTHYASFNFWEIGQPVYEKFLNSKKQIIKLYQRGKLLLKENASLVKKLKKDLGDKPGKEKLIEAVRLFGRQYEEVNFWYSIMPFWSIEYWQKAFQEKLVLAAKRARIEAEIDLLSASILKPWKKTALVELEEKIAAGQSPKKLALEYQFLRSWSFIWYKPITADWVNSLKHKATKKTKKTVLLNHDEILKKLKPDKFTKHFIEIAPYMVFFKDFRDDLRRKHVYFWSFLFEKIAKYLELSIEELGYLNLNEIEQALSGQFKSLEKIIKYRRAQAIFVSLPEEKGKVTMVEGEEAKPYKKIVAISELIKTTSGIKGLSTFKGKAVGKVKIIKNYDGIKKFKPGMVLVANTTHPNYLPAMKMATAIVTDEGGITSHAAIVSREFGIPCIVATKVATKVLKDGNLVEVDANKGIVKMIKK